MTLSVRERTVLEAIGRCQAVGRTSLEFVMQRDAGIPADELWIVVQSLQRKGAVTVNDGVRTQEIRSTSAGRRALAEESRHA